MTVAWVVQTNVEAESTSPALLRRACAELKLPFHEVAVTRGQPELPDFPNAGDPVVFHGRSTLIQRAAGHPLWHKAVFFSPERFRHDAYVAGYASAMLNAHARLLSVDQLLASNYHPSAPLFVRPADDSKAFTGRSLRFSECERLFCELQTSALEVVVGEAYEIDAEYRLFLVDAKVVGGSMYRPSAEPTLPDELIQFAERAAQNWTPAPVFVMDVARVDRTWKIVECNCFNGSRFYEADVTAIVRAVSSLQAARW